MPGIGTSTYKTQGTNNRPPTFKRIQTGWRIIHGFRPLHTNSENEDEIDGILNSYVVSRFIGILRRRNLGAARKPTELGPQSRSRNRGSEIGYCVGIRRSARYDTFVEDFCVKLAIDARKVGLPRPRSRSVVWIGLNGQNCGWESISMES